MGASPCIEDSRYNPDSKSGLVGGKVVRKNRFVPYGKTTKWVDPAARKHFVAIDAEARDNDKRDFDFLKKAVIAAGGKVPDDVTLSELGEAYDKIDPRMTHNKHVKAQEKRRKIEFDSGDSSEIVGLTNAQLKAKIDDLGGEYPFTANKAQLKDILSKLEADKEE
jgi:hypothetical protein